MNNMSNKEYYEDEVNLRDYVEVILKYKWLIIGIFLATVITTAIVSLTMPKKYEATTAIMITPSKIQRTLSPDKISLSGTFEEGKISLKSTISIPTHRELLRSNTVLKKVIDKLYLSDSKDQKISPDSLTLNLDIERTERTNVLKLRVKNKDPELAKEIANTWASEYIIYIQGLVSGEINTTGEFITEQFKIAKQNLIQTEEEIKDFKNKYKLDLMKSELHIKKSKLNGDKKELIDLGFILKTKQDLLNQLKETIKGQDKYILLSKAITDNALWEKIIKDRSVGNIDKKKLTSEILNPVYQDLEKRIINTNIEINTLIPKIKYLKSSIPQVREEINSLDNAINEKEFELTQLNRQVNIYKKTYNNLSNKIEEARIAKAALLDEVKIVSSAVIPESAVSASRKQKVAISGVVSLMLAVFLAFFIEFLHTSEPSEKVKKRKKTENSKQ